MAATYLNTSTLSLAVGRDDNEFTVASTTNVSVGCLLVLRGEAMQVREIPIAGRVKVRRGYQGTRAIPHPASARFFIGDPDDFKTIRDNALAVIGDGGTPIPDYCLPGTRASDSAGNEYIMVDLTATIVQGATVVISRDGNFTAEVLTSASTGSVGLLVESGTSDQWVWAQIYGYHAHAKMVVGSSLMTSTGVLLAATSVSTPNVGVYGVETSVITTSQMDREHPFIYGMFPASACSTGAATSTSETGFYCEVWLHYPFVTRLFTSG